MRNLGLGTRTGFSESKLALTMICCASLLLDTGNTLQAAQRKLPRSRVHEAVAKLAPAGPVPAGQRFDLVIGLALRNQAEFTNLLSQLYEPTSTNFHHFLTSPEFMARFGPTEADYQAVADFARRHGLQVTDTFDERGLVHVSGAASDIEAAFQVTLYNYQHPSESRQFYAPDSEPTIDASAPILDISGLDNFVVPHPMLHLQPNLGGNAGNDANGTGPGGNYRGNDFRQAYAPNVASTGGGQNVGLYEPEGFYSSDISTYESQAGLPNVPIQIIYLDGYNSGNSPNQTDTNGVAECSLDIEMVISMAPGINKLYVFEGNNTDDMLGSMVTNTQIKQFSTSWGMSQDSTAETYLQRMQSQGQSFFAASGDGCAYVIFPIPWPSDDPNLVTVGGTTLAMNGAGTSYNSDTVWNSGYFGANNTWFANGQSGYWGSGGGVSTTYSIPFYQQGVNMSGNGGSTVWRNIPDVSMTANNVWVDYDSGLAGSFVGTSCAAPLWAGFAALVNQQAAARGQSSVGFLNPAFYAIGQSPLYAKAFHDVTTGNNFWPNSPSQYSAATGFDLGTGWGTPNGQGMIDSLLTYNQAVWVDYNYTGIFQFGSFYNPFATLAQAVAVVGNNEYIWFRSAGSKAETLTITKPMSLNAWNGAATVGH